MLTAQLHNRRMKGVAIGACEGPHTFSGSFSCHLPLVTFPPVCCLFFSLATIFLERLLLPCLNVFGACQVLPLTSVFLSYALDKSPLPFLVSTCLLFLSLVTTPLGQPHITPHNYHLLALATIQHCTSPHYTIVSLLQFLVLTMHPSPISQLYLL